MQQYKRCFRDYNINDYVNIEWIYEQLDKQNNKCLICVIPLEAFLNENNIVKSNITIDRIDNKISHIKIVVNYYVTCATVQKNKITYIVYG